MLIVYLQGSRRDGQNTINLQLAGIRKATKDSSNEPLSMNMNPGHGVSLPTIDASLFLDFNSHVVMIS